MWFLQTLNEKYEAEVSVVLSIQNVPENVSFDEGGDLTFNVMLRDDGTELLGYSVGSRLVVKADWSEFKNDNGRLTLPLSALSTRVINSVRPSTEFVKFVSDTLVLNVKKEVATLPVSVNRSFTVADNCELLSIETMPSTVIVAALPDVLSSMNSIATESLEGVVLSMDTVLTLALDGGKGVSADPANVQVKFRFERLVKKEVRVPLELVNFPHNSAWYSFPVSVNISFDVASADYDKVVPGDFKVQLDYNDFMNAAVGDGVHFSLVSSPGLATNIYLEPSAIIKTEEADRMYRYNSLLW